MLMADVESILGGVESYVKDNLGAIEIGAAGLVAGAALGGGAVAIAGAVKARKRKSSSKRKRKRYFSSKFKRRKSRKRKGRRTPHTAGKGKDRSHKRIRYTRKGQPYVIMASGKARFIKKKGAKASHKRKGGRY